MFNLETERKIVDFIKKSPIGVTSSDISRSVGLKRMTINKYLAVNLPKEELKGALEKSGISIGEDINRMYVNFYGTQKLSFDQLCDAYADIGKKLGGSFKVVAHSEKISVEIVQSPFEEANKEAMNTVFSAVFAKVASLNLGYEIGR